MATPSKTININLKRKNERRSLNHEHETYRFTISPKFNCQAPNATHFPQWKMCEMEFPRDESNGYDDLSPDDVSKVFQTVMYSSVLNELIGNFTTHSNPFVYCCYRRKSENLQSCVYCCDTTVKCLGRRHINSHQDDANLINRT